MQPLISIIIPVYNRAELLRETLESVFLQTYENWEAIIVDDHSVDDSERVIRAFIAKDNRFSFYKRQARIRGACTCRNEGLAKAQGDYVIFLDSDDILAAYCLEIRVKAFLQNPQYDFLIFSTLLFNNVPGDSQLLLNVFSIESTLERFLSMDVVWLSTGPIWKKSSLLQIGGWDENIKSGQDWELSIRAIVSGLKFVFFNNVDNYWRTNSAVKISNDYKTYEHLFGRLYLFRKIIENLKKGDCFNNRNRKIVRFTYIAYLINMSETKNWSLVWNGFKEYWKFFPEYRLSQCITILLLMTMRGRLGSKIVKVVNGYRIRCGTLKKIAINVVE